MDAHGATHPMGMALSHTHTPVLTYDHLVNVFSLKEHKCDLIHYAPTTLNKHTGSLANYMIPG